MADQPRAGVLVHDGRPWGREGGYKTVVLPESEEHQFSAEKGVGRWLAACSCGGWQRDDGCGPCLHQTFIDHVADTTKEPEDPPRLSVLEISARRLCAEVWRLVENHTLDPRSPAGDACLDLRDAIDSDWWPVAEDERARVKP